MKKTEINNYEDKEQRLFKLKQTRKERKKIETSNINQG